MQATTVALKNLLVEMFLTMDILYIVLTDRVASGRGGVARWARLSFRHAPVRDDNQ